MDRVRAALFVLVAILFFCFLGTKKSALDNIKKVGLNSRYYPKRYVLLPRRVRKLFRIEQRMVPRFLYFELLLAMLWVIYALALAVYALLAPGPFNGWLILIPLVFCVLEVIFSSVMTRIHLRGGEK